MKNKKNCSKTSIKQLLEQRIAKLLLGKVATKNGDLFLYEDKDILIRSNDVKTRFNIYYKTTKIISIEKSNLKLESKFKDYNLLGSIHIDNKIIFFVAIINPICLEKNEYLIYDKIDKKKIKIKNLRKCGII